MRNDRRSLYAKINIGKKELGLSEGEYRAMLDAKFGTESAKDLTLMQLSELVRHMQKLGFVPKSRNRPNNRIHPMCRKIWAQCYSLERPVPGYADGIAKKMFGVEKLIWCDHTQLRAITTALAKQQDREGADTE